MEDLLNMIRSALAGDASDDVKASGAVACRTILARLEPTAAAPIAASAPPSQSPAETIASVVGMLRGVPPEQLLDLAITRLRAALPIDGRATPEEGRPTTPIDGHAAPSAVRFQMVAVPRARTKVNR